MSKKTVKDLEREISVQNKMIKKLNSNYDSLLEKYDELENKYIQSNSKTTTFNCTLCGEKCQSGQDLGRHRRSEHRNEGSYKCDVCEKVFDQEWKRKAHVKSHKKYQCDYCDKTFLYENFKDKHITAVHEHLKLYCHYFNNKKVCPFDTQCIFLHEDSEECKFGRVCERVNCMYRHNVNVVELEDNEVADSEHDDKDRNTILAAVNEEALEDDIEDENADLNSDANTIVDNPSKDPKPYKCDLCNFASENAYCVENHKLNDHPLNCCKGCPDIFPTKSQRRKHHRQVHNINI